MTAPPPVPDAAPMSVRGAILRGAGLIMVVTVAARVAGFGRNLVFGASVGGGDVGTAYATANLLPNVMFEIVAGGALAAVVVPLVAGLIPGDGARGDGSRDGGDGNGRDGNGRDGLPAAGATTAGAAGYGATAGSPGRGLRTANHVVSALLTWTLLITVPLTAVLAWWAEPIARVLLNTGEDTAAMTMIGADLLRIFSVQLPLYGIAVVLGAYLQARKRFLWPALMPLLSSLVVMAAYRLYAAAVPPVATASTIGSWGTIWLGWGTTAGVAAMALPVLIVAHRSGWRYRPALRMPAGLGRRAVALAGSGLGAVGAQQLTMALVLLLSMRAGGTGTLVVFQYAFAVYLLPFAILVVPLMTASFPHLSEQRLTGDAWTFARTATEAVRTVATVAVIGAAVLIAAAPAIEQFFRLIDRSSVQGVGPAVAAMALGLTGYAVTMQCTRVLSAALRAGDALLVGSLGWVVAAALITLLTLTSPTRRAAEAATGFGLAIAIGMTCAALLGVSRLGELIISSGEQSRMRRLMLISPVALGAGAIPGWMVSRLLVRVEMTEVPVMLIGLLAGIVALMLSAGVLIAAEPAAAQRLRATAQRRLRRGRGSEAPDPGR